MLYDYDLFDNPSTNIHKYLRRIKNPKAKIREPRTPLPNFQPFEESIGHGPEVNPNDNLYNIE